MDLLGGGVRWVAAGLLVAGLAGGTALTTWHWRRRALDAAKNLVALVVAVLLCLVAVGLELNRQNAWYPSTGALLGEQEQTVPAADLGARGPEGAFGRVAPERADGRVLPALPAPGQRLQHFTVAAGHRRWPVDVLLPEGYFDAANARRAYPVAFFAHGVPGAIVNFQQQMPVAALLDPLVRQHRVAPFIAVMPEVMPGGMDTECVVGPDGDRQMEDWLAVDVPRFVHDHLRAARGRESWAVAGYSAGGWCAAMLPVVHPDVFGAGVVLGGYFTPLYGSRHPHWPASSAQARRLDVVHQVATRHPRVALYVQTARDDHLSWPGSRQLLAAVKAPTLVGAEVNATGGHSWGLWVPGLVNGFTWMGHEVPGFRP